MKRMGLYFLLIGCILPSVTAKGNTESTAGGKVPVPDKAALAAAFEVDTFEVGGKTLDIYSIGHGTLLLIFDSIVIHVDPVAANADYTKLPQADLILITHEHGDHLDAKTIALLKKENTVILTNESSAGKLGEGTVMKTGDVQTVLGISIEAVPAYNITEARTQYHPKGRDIGFILTLGGKRIYIAGDTEDIPEMKALKDIYIAFLPMNQPYTMLPLQVAAAAKAFKPAILFPYHYGETSVAELQELLKDTPIIDLRIRQLK